MADVNDGHEENNTDQEGLSCGHGWEEKRKNEAEQKARICDLAVETAR